MRLLSIVLIGLLLSSCDSKPEKIDLASCFGNHYCEEAAIKAFDKAEEYDALEAFFRLSPYQPQIAHDNRRYWELLKATPDCSVLLNPNYRFECEYAKTHQATSLAACQALPDPQKVIIDYDDRSTSTRYRQPRSYCTEMLAATLAEPEQCLDSEIPEDFQQHCLRRFAYHQEKPEACLLLTDTDEQQQCQREAGTLAAKDFAHCGAITDNKAQEQCLAITFIRARLIDSPLADGGELNCALADSALEESCLRLKEKLDTVLKAKLSRCEDRQCRHEVLLYIAFHQHQDFNSLADIEARCTVLPETAHAECHKKLAEYLAERKLDIRWCPGEKGYAGYNCTSEILDYLASSQPGYEVDCAIAGSLHEATAQAQAQANCAAQQRSAKAIVAEDFKICDGNDSCLAGLNLHLQQQQKPNVSACQTHPDPDATSKCADALNDLYAKRSGEVKFCSDSWCVNDVLERHATLDCASMPPSSLKQHCEQKMRFAQERQKLTIKGCTDYHDDHLCADDLIAYRLEQGNLSELNVLECESFDRNKNNCYSKLARARQAPQLCRDELCFSSRFEESLKERQAIDHSMCQKSQAVEQCPAWLKNAIAKVSFNIQLCSNDRCYENILANLQKLELNRFYLNSLGISDDMLKPYFSHFFDWKPKFDEDIDLKVPPEAFFKAIKTDPNHLKLKLVADMLRVQPSACNSLPEGLNFWKKPYRLDCEQQVNDYLAQQNKQPRLCGSTHCVDRFIKSGDITTKADCQTLNPVYTDAFGDSKLVDRCVTALSAKP